MMAGQRTPLEKAAVAIAACCLVWVVGATSFFSSGGLNSAGLIPSLGCLVALWGAIRSDSRLMWVGTAIVLVSAVALLFSVGLVVAPAAGLLLIGSLGLSHHSNGSG